MNGFACVVCQPTAVARSVSVPTSAFRAGGVGPESASTRAAPGCGKKLQPVKGRGGTDGWRPSRIRENGSGSWGPRNTSVRCHSDGSTLRQPGGRRSWSAAIRIASEADSGTGKQRKRLPITNRQYTIAYVPVGTSPRSLFRSSTLPLAALALVLGACAVLFPLRARAEVAFNANTVLDDRDLDTTLAPGSSLSPAAVAQFLGSTGGALGRMTFLDAGVQLTVPQIITRAAAESHISAQYLLALLEKEQGLISDPTPTQRQLDFATGFGCPSSCDPAYRGFAVQVHRAAARTRQYLEDLAARNQTVSGWGVGVTKVTVDGIAVTPTNRATAAVYTYNPLVGKYGGGDSRYGATSLLWRLWQRWFVARYPDGTLLRASGSGGIWLLENGQRRPFTSRSAFLSGNDPAKVIEVPSSVLALYPVGTPIRFPSFGLVQIETGGVYLLDGEVKRPIPSRTVFRSLGFNPEEVIRARASDLADLARGEPVSEDDQFPTGQLFQIRGTGGIIYVKGGERHAVIDRAIWKTRFGSARPTAITVADALRYRPGDPVRFRDGELVTAKGDPTIYVISNRAKRPIAGMDTFRRLGYRWSNIVWTSTAALALHPTGEPVVSVSL